MANNLLRHINTIWSGHTLSFRLRNPAGFWWNGTTVETYSVADLALYAILAAEQGVAAGSGSGFFTADTPALLPVGQWDADVSVLASLTAAVTNVGVTSNVATITTSANHGFTSGRSVILSGLTNAFLNGIWPLTAASGATFSFPVTHGNLSSTADSGTALSSASGPAASDQTLGASTGFWDGTNWHQGPGYVDSIDGVIVEPSAGGQPAINLRQANALQLAALAGILSGAGPGGGTITIENPGGTVTRIQMQTDQNGNRTRLVELNPPA